MNKKIEDDFVRIIESHRKIGVFVSGGMDSTLMTYLLYLNRAILEKDVEFRFYTVPRSDSSVDHARRILAYITNEFHESIPEHIIVGNPHLHHSLQVGSGIKVAMLNSSLDLILNGTNATPEEVPDGPLRRESKDPRVYMPFFDVKKDEILQMYIHYGQMDLLKQTHTCTESRRLRCSQCWQCKERKWAFDKLGVVDPGRM